SNIIIMKIFLRQLSLFVILFGQNVTFGQVQPFEIFGKFKGDHKDTVFLFFDNNFSQKDSLYSTINQNGEFHFVVKNELPILCRIHCGEKSSLDEFYVDNSKTFLELESHVSEKEVSQDSGGSRAIFSIKNIIGSQTDSLIRDFNKWKIDLRENHLGQNENDEYFTKLKSIILKYPKNKASAYLLAGRIFIMGKAFMYRGKHPLEYNDFITLKNQLDKSLQKTLEWENLTKIQNSLEIARHRVKNEPFLNQSLQDVSEKIVPIINFKNKITLVDFWASWCKPCRASFPSLKSLYSIYKADGFEIIGISIDNNKKAWKDAISNDKLPWKQLIDTSGVEGKLCSYYDIRGVPFQILIDHEGKILAYPSSLEQIEEFIKETTHLYKK
ncbi:MAG: TlpA disulfide reductase family protein, partial [Sediminibacterium sp.]|nr:TlpA disulfide reductase family protein [Sediminibacterium sp.]